MKRRDPISLDDVRAAKPELRPTGQEWLESEGGRRVLERILAADRAESARRSAHKRLAARWAGPRLAFAGAVVAIAVAVGIAVAFAGHDGSPEATVAATGTSTQEAARVSNVDAVADVMSLYQMVAPLDMLPEGDRAALAVQAAKLGLVDEKAVLGASASAAMSQGEYAVLLVKAFGGLLSDGPSPTLAVDPAAISSPGAAVRFLQDKGVILPEDGAFSLSKPLTVPVEERLLSRLRDALSSLIE